MELYGSDYQFPSISDRFLKQIHSSEKKWIITHTEDEHRMILESDSFLRYAIFNKDAFTPYSYCHRPIIIKDGNTLLGDIISRFKVYPDYRGDDVVDEDVILLWDEEKRIITGSDILGRLLRGIVRNEGIAFNKQKQKKK